MKSKVEKNNKLLPKAKELRKNLTEQERKLWYEFLRYHPVKFYKQRIIASYIVDFYCASAKLVIELDGGQHYEEAHIEYDRQRTAKLESCGLKVLRFTNLEISKEFEGVCEFINMELEARIGSPFGRAGGEAD